LLNNNFKRYDLEISHQFFDAAPLMSSYENLLIAAYHSEKVTSRRLASRALMSPEQALTRVLEIAAGPAGLMQLLVDRARQREADIDRRAVRRETQVRAQVLKRIKHQVPKGVWEGWFDGSARPNPGCCGIGAVLQCPDGTRSELSEPAGYGSSSDAEYCALIALLEMALVRQPANLLIYGDSKVVIDDVISFEKNAAISLRHHRVKAQALMAQLPQVSLRWIPRHKNGAADVLSQRASDTVQAAAMQPENIAEDGGSQ
jgi:ribonuclease HI